MPYCPAALFILVVCVLHILSSSFEQIKMTMLHIVRLERHDKELFRFKLNKL